MSDQDFSSGIIQVLPENLANKIAAGEVVQRPASVLKELLENAIDAGARRVSVAIKKSGSELVQVIDDGCGMAEADAAVCFQRHATSKIRSVEDLEQILTLGFRGEALASIAAVSQVELRTRRVEDSNATCVVIHGGKVERIEPCAAPAGTSVSVRNLFFNVPARRNFLRSPATEFKHLVETFQFIALSHPEVAFNLNHEGRDVFDLPAEKAGQERTAALKARIAGVVGGVDERELIEVDAESSYASIKGVVSKPDFSKRLRGDQFLFVNDRFVRHRGLDHAVLSAYGEMLPKGSYPFFALFLRMNPRHVDVNVHPTKSEVKFDDESGVYGFLRAAVKKALGEGDLAPDLAFGADGRLRARPMGDALDASSERHVDPWPGHRDQRAGLFDAPREGFGTGSAFRRNTYGTPGSGVDAFAHLFRPHSESQAASVDSGSEPAMSSGSTRPADTGTGSGPRMWQLSRKYLLVEAEDGLVIVDQHAAHERILYERFLRALEAGQSASQQLLFPITVELSAQNQTLLADLLPDFRILGFDMEFFGGRTVLVRGIPLDIPAGNEQGSLEEVLDQFRAYRERYQLRDRDNLAKSLSCRSAIKTGQSLSRQEMTALLDALHACEMPHACPHGRPTMIHISIDELDRRFGRIGHLERE